MKNLVLVSIFLGFISSSIFASAGLRCVLAADVLDVQEKTVTVKIIDGLHIHSYSTNRQCSSTFGETYVIDKNSNIELKQGDVAQIDFAFVSGRKIGEKDYLNITGKHNGKKLTVFECTPQDSKNRYSVNIFTMANGKLAANLIRSNEKNPASVIYLAPGTVSAKILNSETNRYEGVIAGKNKGLQGFYLDVDSWTKKAELQIIHAIIRHGRITMGCQ